MAKFKEGNRVQIKSREATADEAKNGRYAPYLGSATGSVLKVYNEQEVAVKIELDSLSEVIQERHQNQQDAMQQKWLDSLSEEARNRLTPEEKALRLNYVVLLAESDLMPYKEGKRAPAPQTAEETPKDRIKIDGQTAEATRAKDTPVKDSTVPEKEAAAKSVPEKAATVEAKASSKPKKSTEAPAGSNDLPKRKTSEELDAIEEQYLKTRKRS